MHTLAIIEDSESIREVLVGFFSEQAGYDLRLAAVSFEDFVARWKGMPLDVVLCDIGLPGNSGVEAAWHIKQHSPQTEVVMLTVFEDRDHIFRSICSGASGYLLKNTPLVEIRKSLDDIMAGGAAMSPQIARQVMGFFTTTNSVRMVNNHLTPREIEITSCIQEGLGNKDIAQQLSISINAVKFHIKNIYVKLQVGSRAELINLYRQPMG